jgi:hypothetical protein
VDVALLRGLHEHSVWLEATCDGRYADDGAAELSDAISCAEMLRIACCLATERGVSVCAPVHDALVIEAPVDQIDDAVTTTRA